MPGGQITTPHGVMGMQAGGALTKRRFVRQSGGQTVVQTSASTQRSLGVVDTDVSADEATRGKQVPVFTQGLVWVEAGAAIALDARVMADASGRAITAATATNIPTGVCRGAVGGAGEWALIELTPGQPPL